MDLLNNLSKIAKSVGESAVTVAKKSGEVVEKTKLNASISAENDKIKILYEEIGEEVYAKYKQGETIIDDLIVKCGEIDQVSDYLEGIKNRILQIEDIKLCPSCGEQIEFKVLYCPMCGVKQPILKIKLDKEEDTEEDEADKYLFKETGENCEGTECTFDRPDKVD